MTLPFRHRIRNSSLGCLRLSTGAPHNIQSLRVSGDDFFLKLEGQSGIRTRDIRLSKQAALTTTIIVLQAVLLGRSYIIYGYQKKYKI